MYALIISYWVGMLLEVAIRAPYQKNARSGEKQQKRPSTTETVLVSLLSVFMLLIPFVYSVSGWLNFANYSLPGWLGWIGVILLTGSLVLFWLAHRDLQNNWSPTLEIYREHRLVTHGIYAVIRHPMYASQLLWVLAQPLLMQNWLAGPLDILFFIAFYLLRVRAEEKMMLDAFGEEYREYKNRTGGLFPMPGKPKS